MRLISKFVLIISMISWNSHAFVPTAKNLSQLEQITLSQESALSSLASQKFLGIWQLDRLDLELAVSASGDIGILGINGQSAIELIWEKQEPKSKKEGYSEPSEISLSSSDSKHVFLQLRDEILNSMGSVKLTRRQIRRINRILKKDAEDITKWIIALRDMPQVGEWYIDGFFKTYYFSANAGLSNLASASYDKRLRFRFVFSGPFRRKILSAFSPKHKAHRRIMEALNRLTQLESPAMKYELSRVWLRTDLMLEKDFVVFSSEVGRGFQTVYRRVPKEKRSLTFPLDKTAYIPTDLGEMQYVPQSLIGVASSPLESTFPLNQIRLKFEFSANSSFKLATPEVTQIIDLHYFRKDP